MPTTPRPAPPRPDGVRTLTEAKALSALANPFRARMVDALKVDGPSTASALAARTGQAVGSASHHLKVLAEAGLVESSVCERIKVYQLCPATFDALASRVGVLAARAAEVARHQPC